MSGVEQFETRMTGKWPAMAILTTASVLAMSLWFSASAVLPAWQLEYDLTGFQAALISSSVSGGFVVGTLLSAILGLADRLNPRRFFMMSCMVAASANALLLVVSPVEILNPMLRFVVGMATAGIYPVGMKMAVSWSNRDRGLLVGLLVGALTLGSA